MGKFRDLLDREVDRHDLEWMETMQRLTVTEKTEKRPVIIRGRDVERDCRSIVNQLVNSMPKDVLLRTSFTERGKSTPVQVTEEVRVKSKSSFTRKVHFTDAKKEYEPSSDCSSGDETRSGESGTFGAVQADLSGERLMRQPRDRLLSGSRIQSDQGTEFCPGSRETSQTDWNMMVWNHSAQVMTRGSVLGQHIWAYFQFWCIGDCDSFLVGGLETARAIKRDKDVSESQIPEIMRVQLNVKKTYLKARYRLSDLLRAQRNDRMTSNLKRWIEKRAPDKRYLEEDNYKILKQFYLKRKDLLYLNKDGIVAFKRKEEDKVFYKYNSIVLPQLYQTHLLFRSHDQMGHQGVDKVYNRIQKQFEWPGLKKWISACLLCQQAKDPKKLRFPLQSIVIGIQRSSANWSTEDMHDSHWLQSGAGNDRSFHKIYRGSSLHDSIGGRNMQSLDKGVDSEARLPSHVQSLDKCVDSEARLPRHISIRQWQSIRGRSHEGVNEEVAGGTGSLDHLSPTNEWPSREAKSLAGIYVESLLLKLHGWLG